MLQWMGGSRRKVATSRKSTQKRQKQYFEQRKRQHQQYEAAFVEHNVDASATCDHHRGGRSLDILSLLNVSNVTETRRALCDNAIHQPSISKNTPASLNHEASTTGHGEPISARTPSSQHLRTMSSEGTWRNASNVRKTESECLKNASSNQLSILDLIGDDGATTASEGNPAHEAHVAFSIEGLGDIGTKTPMQSPRRPGRRLSGDQSSFTKAFKKPHPFKNFNTMLDDLGMEEKRLVEETEKPSKDDHLDSFSISEDVLYPFSSADHEPLILKNDMQLDKAFWMNSFHKQDRHHNLWNADSSFLDNGGNYDKRLLNWKNGIATDNPYSWRKDSPDLKFEGCNSLLRFQL
uniref:Uncharacterized protein n=2 Tax=Opuntia streptacantha TaxID=393608 RepID=A0A7C9EI01_OPUST